MYKMSKQDHAMPDIFVSEHKVRFRHEFHRAPYEVFSHVSHPFFHGSPNARVNTSLELARDVMTPAILRCWLRKMPDRYHEIDPGLSDHSSRSKRQAPFANNLKLGHWRTYTACRPQHHQHTNSVDARIPLSQLLQEFCPQRLGSPHCRELLSRHRTTIAVPLTFPSHCTASSFFIFFRRSSAALCSSETLR